MKIGDVIFAVAALVIVLGTIFGFALFSLRFLKELTRVIMLLFIYPFSISF